ncbi:hypothetical protein D3C72_2098870 [compost metagenome]
MTALIKAEISLVCNHSSADKAGTELPVVLPGWLAATTIAPCWVSAAASQAWLALLPPLPWLITISGKCPLAAGASG